MKLSYTNYRKQYGPSLSDDVFKSWFSLKRYWGGKLIHLSVRHHALVFDFRKDFLSDMTYGRLSLRKIRQKEKP